MSIAFDVYPSCVARKELQGNGDSL